MLDDMLIDELLQLAHKKGDASDGDPHQEVGEPRFGILDPLLDGSILPHEGVHLIERQRFFLLEDVVFAGKDQRLSNSIHSNWGFFGFRFLNKIQSFRFIQGGFVD